METVQYDLKPRVKEFLKNDVQELYVNGQYTPAVNGETFSVLDTATETEITKVSEAQEKNIDIAVQDARDAFDNGEWTKMEAAERSRLIYKFADLMEEHREELA